MSRHVTALADYRARLLRRISNQHPDLAAVETLKLQWFRVLNAVDSDAADVYIYDEIGGSFGVNPSELVQEINGITASTIDVHINSPGGDLFDSIGIYNALVKHPALVNVYVDSLAASGASIVAMAGNKVTMMRGSQMMIHDALAMMLGNARDFTQMATFLDRQSDNIASIYAARADGTELEHRTRMLDETWMFANEAVQMGYADSIYVPPADAQAEDASVDVPVAGLVTYNGLVAETDARTDAVTHEDIMALAALMTKRHRLDNRGFKFQGREAAPAPSAPVALEKKVAMPDAAADKMAAILRKGLGH